MIFSQFTKYSNLKYGFSKRADGSMNKRLEKDSRKKYFTSINIDSGRVVTADLVHGASVVKVSNKEAGKMIVKTDGLVTASKNLFLSATAADCFLLYFYDPMKNVVGIAHVGWRGLLAGVVDNMVGALIKNLGLVSQNIIVSISPGIRECHFEITKKDGGKYKEYANFVLERDNKVFVSLPNIIKNKLLNKGVLAEHIEDCNICTYCNERDYFSYRRDKPKDVQVQVGYIGLN